jgi:hypothetical protein
VYGPSDPLPSLAPLPPPALATLAAAPTVARRVQLSVAAAGAGAGRVKEVDVEGAGVLVCWCAGVLVCWCAGVLVQELIRHGVLLQELIRHTCRPNEYCPYTVEHKVSH